MGFKGQANKKKLPFKASLPVKDVDKGLEVVDQVSATKSLAGFLLRHKTIQQGLHQLPHLIIRLMLNVEMPKIGQYINMI